jgi:hypothetical protein
MATNYSSEHPIPVTIRAALADRKNKLAKFRSDASADLQCSILSDDGTSVTVEGDLIIEGSLDVTVDASAFDNLLDSGATTIQAALQQLNDNYYFSGVYVAPSIVDNGDGSVTLSDGEYCLCTDLLGCSAIKKYSIAGRTFVLEDNATNYVVAGYNDGDPCLCVVQDRLLIDMITRVPVYTIYRQGTRLSTLWWDHSARQLANKWDVRMVRTERFKRESGFNLGVGDSQNITISAGYIWYGAIRQTLPAIDSATDLVLLHYHTAEGLWTDAAITEFDNSHYDEGTGLETTTPNRYVINWVYRSAGEVSTAFVVVGTTPYLERDVAAAQPPDDLPDEITKFSFLVGRIVVQSGATTPYSTDSAFAISFTPSNVANHNVLDSLQGGDTEEYYHLTETQHTALTTIQTAPTAATAAGTAGQVIVANDAIYVCVATDTWKRALLSTW